MRGSYPGRDPKNVAIEQRARDYAVYGYPENSDNDPAYKFSTMVADAERAGVSLDQLFLALTVLQVLEKQGGS